MTTSSATIISTVSATLASEGWAEVRPPLADASAIAFASPEVTIRLVVAVMPGGQLAAELAGHPVGYPATAIWSLSVTDPTEAHLLEIARAAADDRVHGVLDLAGYLAGAGWTLEAGGPGSRALCQMTSADDGHALIRLRGAEDASSGWAIDGDGVRADATDNVPAAILAALAAAPRGEPEGESEGVCDPGPALKAERPEPPKPDLA